MKKNDSQIKIINIMKSSDKNILKTLVTEKISKLASSEFNRKDT